MITDEHGAHVENEYTVLLKNLIVQGPLDEGMRDRARPRRLGCAAAEAEAEDARPCECQSTLVERESLRVTASTGPGAEAEVKLLAAGNCEALKSAEQKCVIDQLENSVIDALHTHVQPHNAALKDPHTHALADTRTHTHTDTQTHMFSYTPQPSTYRLCCAAATTRKQNLRRTGDCQAGVVFVCLFVCLFAAVQIVFRQIPLDHRAATSPRCADPSQRRGS